MTTAKIHPGTHVAEVALTVSDLRRQVSFYGEVLGLQVRAEASGRVTMGTASRALIHLVEDRQAEVAWGAAGLFHIAFLYPSRAMLAEGVRRVVASGYPLQGASDHGVSEAIYLADPEGNGLELYRDRPRADWPWDGDRLRMGTHALNLRQMLADEPPVPEAHAPEGLYVGHIHLQATDLAATTAFYRDVLGMDLMQRYGAQAAFLSAGGYHHHVGLNTWESQGARPAPPGALGLRWYQLAIPEAATAPTATALRQRLDGYEGADAAQQLHLRDPSGHHLRLAFYGD